MRITDSPHIGKRCLRSYWLDLSCIREGRTYNKGGGRNLIRDFWKHYFQFFGEPVPDLLDR